MITNPARFALSPVILLASLGSVSAKERIVPAVSESVQVIPVNMAQHSGKALSGVPLFNRTLMLKKHSPSYPGRYMPVSGEGDGKTGRSRFKEYGQVSFHQDINNKHVPMQVDRGKS